FGDSVSNLSVALLTAAAAYVLFSNGDIATVDAEAGVKDVSLAVHTDTTEGLPDFVGTGSVGTIALPEGSTLAVTARGNLGNVQALGTEPSRATTLSFEDLTGSITGLEHIDRVMARGWLGT